MNSCPFNVTLNEIIYLFLFQNTRIFIDWEICVTFKTLKYGIRNSLAQLNIYQPHFFAKVA